MVPLLSCGDVELRSFSCAMIECTREKQTVQLGAVVEHGRRLNEPYHYYKQ